MTIPLLLLILYTTLFFVLFGKNITKTKQGYLRFVFFEFRSKELKHGTLNLQSFCQSRFT